jgi:phage portal protein BeeE
MGLLDRIRNEQVSAAPEKRFAVDDWLTQYLFPSQFQYGNTTYPYGMPAGMTTTMGSSRVQAITASMPGYMRALSTCPPAFAAQMVRALVLSQVRFTFRNPPWDPISPRKSFGTQALSLLERPWPNGTTGDLVGLMEWHAGLSGNAFVLRQPNRLRVLRPDFVAAVYGSQLEPDHPDHAVDGELIGYIYQNGGIGNRDTQPQLLNVKDVAHWSPIPDPLTPGMGMSWVTAGLRDIQADKAASEFKTKYLTNGATPNLVVTGIPAVSRESFNEIVDMLEERHTGFANAFKTLYLTGTANATVVGSNLQQLDMRTTQGGGETRISMLSRVPAPVLGIAAGLEGSSLNAGNFGQARRLFADTWVYPALQDLAHALATVIDVPPRAELWFDTLDIPLLREDSRDAAEINRLKAETVSSLIAAGYTPDTVVAAVDSGDFRLLKHTGLYSVQLQKPGGESSAGAGAQAPAATDSEQARAAAEAIQKVYLGVGVVVSDQEARELIRRAGADISGPLPAGTAPTPSGGSNGA